MTPSFIGRYATISSGVRPIISFAALPIARTLLVFACTATTEGSFKTTPFPGTKTRTLVVPRSMPSLGEKKAIVAHDTLQSMRQEGLNFVVEGGRALKGEVTTSRSKNGAVALLAATLLNRGTTTLEHVPKIEEVNRLIEILRSMGVNVEWKDCTLVIKTPDKIDLASINSEAAMKTRSILMFIGPLLHHFDKFELPQSGGCTLGLRSARPHLMALEKFGVSITAHSNTYDISHT